MNGHILTDWRNSPVLYPQGPWGTRWPRMTTMTWFLLFKLAMPFSALLGTQSEDSFLACCIVMNIGKFVFVFPMSSRRELPRIQEQAHWPSFFLWFGGVGKTLGFEERLSNTISWKLGFEMLHPAAYKHVTSSCDQWLHTLSVCSSKARSRHRGERKVSLS